MKTIEQWEAIKLMATERKVDIDDRNLHNIRIGAKRYTHPTYATCALISAFKKLGIHIPDEILARPSDME